MSFFHIGFILTNVLVKRIGILIIVFVFLK